MFLLLCGLLASARCAVAFLHRNFLRTPLAEKRTHALLCSNSERDQRRKSVFLPAGASIPSISLYKVRSIGYLVTLFVCRANMMPQNETPEIICLLSYIDLIYLANNYCDTFSSLVTGKGMQHAPSSACHYRPAFVPLCR